MNLAIFDIDGTLTESVAVDEVCFVQAFRDVRAAKALGNGFLGLATGTKAVRLLEEGASCVLPDFSDPVQVAECLEAVARRPCYKLGN
jgi:phosphoglycolate phosphatase-like HAD superfamily hydrolase